MSQAALDALILASRCFGGETLGGWTIDLSITAPLLLMVALYAFGTWRLWRRCGVGRGVSRLQTLLFLAGWLALVIALVTPLHDLSRRLFSAHMIEHEVMMAVAAPLLVLSRPLGVMLWALPRDWRRMLGGVARCGAVARVWRLLTTPLVATVLHGVTIWIWHLPLPFQAALEVEWVHWLQHLGFLVTALLFWWALLRREMRRRYPVSSGHLFATALHTGVLGVLLIFSPVLWYAPMPAAPDWGMTPLEDQQLAGLIMWVPAGLIYVGAAMAVLAAWLSDAGKRTAWPTPGASPL